MGDSGVEWIAVAYLLAYVLERAVDDGSSSISSAEELWSVVCVENSRVALAVGPSLEVDDVGSFSIAPPLEGDPASAASGGIPVSCVLRSSALLLSFIAEEVVSCSVLQLGSPSSVLAASAEMSAVAEVVVSFLIAYPGVVASGTSAKPSFVVVCWSLSLTLLTEGVGEEGGDCTVGISASSLVAEEGSPFVSVSSLFNSKLTRLASSFEGVPVSDSSLDGLSKEGAAISTLLFGLASSSTLWSDMSIASPGLS
mmetsp:Transcript_20969/g.34085  ORF Transcript_20969/g.34085 Transcript_20969/m.34085 type:complete len:254 (+) Transcript_20969:1485-2246(+)